MIPTKKEIAHAFSMGNFKTTYEYLEENIQWSIAGDKSLNGRAAVIDFCESTAAYFTQVETIFTLHNIIAEGDCIAINGRAQFKSKENKVINMDSCDVYIFNHGMLKEITSYCINTSPSQKNK